MDIKLSLLLMALWAVTATAAAGPAAFHITAGPMLGAGGMRSALIWLQGDGAADVQIEYWDPAHPTARHRSAPVRLAARGDYTAKIRLDGLEPGRSYDYRVMADGRPAANGGPLSLHTEPLWQWRGDPPDFTVLTGSCAYIDEARYDRPGKPYGGGYRIFRSMAALHPDVTLWMGDNLYFREADYTSRWGMHYRYAHDRALPALQPLLRTGRHFAIWDDHDYGPNDGNRSFVFKEESLRLFKEYWPNPSFGQRYAPGVFTTVSYGDVDFFLLDDRWYRDSDTMPDGPGKAMFGADQMAWLRDALLASEATFKIIVAGGQMLNDSDTYEGWNHFPDERSAFLNWLIQANIGGVMFMSGDRHQTELLRVPRPKAYPLYELTCSPLTSATHSVADEAKNPVLVAGTLVGQRNFCALRFSGPRHKRRLTVAAYDSGGKELWHREIMAAQLSAALNSGRPRMPLPIFRIPHNQGQGMAFPLPQPRPQAPAAPPAPVQQSPDMGGGGE